jgi:hypothetical protein
VSTSPRYTPGCDGYLCAVLISIGVTAVGIVAPAAPDEGLAGNLPWIFPVACYARAAVIPMVPGRQS